MNNCFNMSMLNARTKFKFFVKFTLRVLVYVFRYILNCIFYKFVADIRYQKSLVRFEFARPPFNIELYHVSYVRMLSRSA